MSRAWAGGSTRRWRKIRAWVLLRDKHLCQLRLPGCTTKAPLRGGHAHHLHGRGRCPACKLDDPTHLVAACASCNIKAGDPGAGQHTPRPRPMTKW